MLTTENSFNESSKISPRTSLWISQMIHPCNSLKIPRKISFMAILQNVLPKIPLNKYSQNLVRELFNEIFTLDFFLKVCSGCYQRFLRIFSENMFQKLLWEVFRTIAPPEVHTKIPPKNFQKLKNSFTNFYDYSFKISTGMVPRDSIWKLDA